MNIEKLNKFVTENENTYNFYNENILHNLIENIQDNINFAFLIEKNKDRINPKLILSEDFEDIESNKTIEYKQPILYISLKKRSPVSSNESNSNKTFAHSNIISGIPRFIKKEKDQNGNFYEYSLMSFDNSFQLILFTKTIKEELEVLNILERSLNIYSNIIKPEYVIASGITSIETKDKKTKEQLTKTIISFEVRTKEVVKIDKNYILKGYKIFTNEFETGSGEIVNDNWEEYPIDDDYIQFP